MVYFIQAISIIILSLPVFQNRLLLSSSTQPQQVAPVILTDQQNKYPLGLHLEILEDPTRQLTIADVTSPEFDEQFINSQEETLNFGYTDSAYWVRFRVWNKTSKTNDWWLEIANTEIDLVNLYLPQPDGSLGFDVKKAGDKLPFITPDFEHYHVVFNLPVKPQTEQMFYLHVDSRRTNLPLILWSDQSFIRKSLMDFLVMGFYWGVLLIMIGYNFFIFLSLRDKSYLYYVLFLTNVLLVDFTRKNFPQRYLWPNQTWLDSPLQIVTVMLTFLFLVSFVTSFLKTSVLAPNLHRLMVGLQIGIVVLMFPLFVWPGAAILIVPWLLLLLLSAVVSIVAGIVIWWHGYRSARYFLIAWIILLGAILLSFLPVFGLLTSNDTEYITQTGVILMVLLLSLALADKINIFRREKEEAQATVLHQQEEALRLNQEYTASLRKANESLKQSLAKQKKTEKALQIYTQDLERSNRELQNFAYVASHDLQEPLRKIQAFSDRLKTRYADSLDERGHDYLDRMENAGHRAQRLIQDLLAFSRVTTKAQPFKSVDLNMVAQNVSTDFDTQLNKLNGQINLGNLPIVQADPNQMKQLFYNLIGNAIKFHQDGIAPVVNINSQYLAKDQCHQITVSDNGIGFDEKYAERIFGIFQRLHGRDNYEGTGVGLAMCQKIVERHKGTITASGKPGQGAIFIVTLPAIREEADNA